MCNLLCANFSRLRKSKIFWTEITFSVLFAIITCVCNYQPEISQTEFRVTLDDVFFSLRSELSCSPYSGFRLIVDKVLIFYNFGAYKAFFEVGVDYTGCLRGFVAFVDGPCSTFVCACGKEGLEAEKVVCSADKAG